MKLILNGKEYKVDKINRKKNTIFNEAYEKIKVKAETNAEFNDNDLDLMVETIVKLYDEQFTEDEVNEEMEVADIIFNFMQVQIEIQSKLNNKIEKAKKAFLKGK
ncbi:hypothetical protein DVW08_05940 [Clostridium botulinum]|nr:hypothetical protein [Clostridium botulinum]